MICYLVRHGKDDETVRGGWSDHPLTMDGIRQSEALAERMSGLAIGTVYSSDLPRAMQTARILARKHSLPVVPLTQFREVNNGSLAGMKNSLALEQYPGLFWNQLDWDRCYPNGESPKQFYARIKTAWEAFSEEILSGNRDVVLVTHGGVIQIIRTILENRQYSNRGKYKKVSHTEVITLSCRDGVWKECFETGGNWYGTQVL